MQVTFSRVASAADVFDRLSIEVKPIQPLSLVLNGVVKYAKRANVC